MKVANILEDPVVNEADLQVYASHTKRFPVRGSGFFSADGKSPSILLDGIPSFNYEVEVGFALSPWVCDGGWRWASVVSFVT